ncbi:hypothetical protein C7N43_34705 [Sphingobacteriales bacterium UPWRP_1]|nr:hypothetical protein C7N43_34705 [Sphingobacteriales bacterium UPWRP_1]
MKNKNVIIVLVAAVVVILLLVFLLPKNTAKDKPATYDSSAGTKPATGNNTSGGGGIAETAIENAAGIISSIGGLIGAIRNKKKDNAAKSAENTNSQQVIV